LVLHQNIVPFDPEQTHFHTKKWTENGPTPGRWRQ
jgi:hypothetical protein